MTGSDWRETLRPRGGEQAIVAFQGELGAYGHLAVDEVWGARAWLLPCPSFAEALASVGRGKADYAVLPVENVIIGEIAGVRSAVLASGLDVVGEHSVAVRHCLLGLPGCRLEDLREVYSHPAALAQCAVFFSRHPHLVPREAYDTAGAARDLTLRRRPDEGAIASERCVERYRLQLLARDIGDRADNATTFVIVRRPPRR